MQRTCQHVDTCPPIRLVARCPGRNLARDARRWEQHFYWGARRKNTESRPDRLSFGMLIDRRRVLTSRLDPAQVDNLRPVDCDSEDHEGQHILNSDSKGIVLLFRGVSDVAGLFFEFLLMSVPSTLARSLPPQAWARVLRVLLSPCGFRHLTDFAGLFFSEPLRSVECLFLFAHRGSRASRGSLEDAVDGEAQAAGGDGGWDGGASDWKAQGDWDASGEQQQQQQQQG